ncbi:MAG: FeoB-associated Cys-rich membrane protein [Anaerofustis sp.]
MIALISDNLSTIIIGAALLGIVTWVVVGLIKKKRAGSSCGCGCDGCSGCSTHNH